MKIPAELLRIRKLMLLNQQLIDVDRLSVDVLCLLSRLLCHFIVLHEIYKHTHTKEKKKRGAAV